MLNATCGSIEAIIRAAESIGAFEGKRLIYSLEKSSGVGIAQIRSCVFYPRPPNKNYNDDDAMGSLEYLIINQFAANNSRVRGNRAN